ncbi:MAG: hypothetical protein WDM81_04375 [Rhizomicrobium sp.]
MWKPVAAADTVATPVAGVYPSSIFSTTDGIHFTAITEFTSTAANTTLAPTSLGSFGGNGAHENRQPYLAMCFCIALEGEFPPRP